MGHTLSGCAGKDCRRACMSKGITERRNQECPEVNLVSAILTRLREYQYKGINNEPRNHKAASFHFQRRQHFRRIVIEKNGF